MASSESSEKSKELLEKLYPINATLLGEGYDKRLEIVGNELPLEILEFPSGTEVGSWKVPDEWVVREAWVKYKGNKIIDFAEEPLSLLTYSEPFKGTVDLDELKKHVAFLPDAPNAVPYTFQFYERTWGFGMPKDKVDKLKKGKYEVFIDTEFKPGTMKLGVHTIQGTSEREVLLFAHLDHPYQANDNLSGVVCLVDLAKKLAPKHTVKIIFCPETIGSVTYALTKDVSKVDFAIAVDICGNKNDVLVQQSYDIENRLNKITNTALQTLMKPYRKARFRAMIGSDEYAFNDPRVGIPGLLVTTWPYKEYHTNLDKPEIIDYEAIIDVQEVIKKIIDVYERDFIPERVFRGPLMRSRYGLQSLSKQVNLNLDYLWYDIDGRKTLSELCSVFQISFDYVEELLNKLIEQGAVRRLDVGKE